MGKYKFFGHVDTTMQYSIVYVFLTPYNGLQSNRYGHNAKMQFLQESIEHKLPSIQKVK